jgi:hypothetical protein
MIGLQTMMHVWAVDVMRKQEALRILAGKLAAIEREHRAECADNEEGRQPIDAKAEARALAAVFDFLRDSKISHTDSVRRVLERYLRPKSRGHTPLRANN